MANDDAPAEAAPTEEPTDANSVEDSGRAEADAPSTAMTPVVGRVVDFWGHELGGVSVQIGDLAAMTDAQGVFRFEQVAVEYDVSIVMQLGEAGPMHAYVYQGVRRRNPTLQVFRGLSDRTAKLETPLSQSAQLIVDGRVLGVAMAGSDGAFDRQYASPGGASLNVSWVGPLTTMVSAHGLVWKNQATTGAPEGYFAHASMSLDLVAGNATPQLFDFTFLAETMVTNTVSGTVLGANSGQRSNTLSLRFASGATLRLSRDMAPGDAFSYLVPVLPDATLAVAAVEGCTSSALPCAIAHQEVAAGGAAISLRIPTPLEGLQLDPPGLVDAHTKFSVASAARATVSVFTNTAGNDRLFVITDRSTFSIPSFNAVYALSKGAVYSWVVTTHGDAQSVDQMTDTFGFIDGYGFSPAGLEPAGPAHSAGQYTSSARMNIEVASPPAR
jgi:hypothetical protein